MVFYRKAHNVRIRSHEPLQKVDFLREHLQPELRMILRRRIVERLIDSILSEPPHIVKEPDDLGECRVVFAASEMLCKCTCIRCNITCMYLFETNPTHHIGIVRAEGTHIVVHPCVHLMQELFHLRSSFHILTSFHSACVGKSRRASLCNRFIALSAQKSTPIRQASLDPLPPLLSGCSRHQNPLQSVLPAPCPPSPAARPHRQ